MKKLFVILLVLTMISTFIACGNQKNDASDTNNTRISINSGGENDGEDDVSPSEFLGIDESEWNTAVQPSNFNNVTFTYNATFLSGYDDVDPHTDTMKIVENVMLMNGQPVSEEERTETKNVLENVVIAIANDFSLFEYDEQNDNYRAIENLTYTATVSGYEVTFIIENALVIIDSDNNIAKITCKMTQSFNEDNGEPTTYVLDAEFTFTDYGTTTLE